MNREQDHPESYSFRDDIICRQGNKVLYRIVKRENIKDKVKGWDNTIGRVDAYVLQMELDFDFGTYRFLYEGREHHDKG